MKPANYAITTTGLGKRYKDHWALQNCEIRVPKGSITALVGPNGAGKSTLIRQLTGLDSPSAGTITALDQKPSVKATFIQTIGYLAQDAPLYNRLNTNELNKLGQKTNRYWNTDFVTNRISELGISLTKPVGSLSGGQRAQVALALAIAKQPELLVLDEPLASLDPLARDDFLKMLVQAVAERNGELTVIISSHLLGNLEQVCDRLILLAKSKVQLCDDIPNILQQHRLITKVHGIKLGDGIQVILQKDMNQRSDILVRVDDPKSIDSRLPQERPGLEDISLAYMQQSRMHTSDKEEV